MVEKADTKEFLRGEKGIESLKSLIKYFLAMSYYPFNIPNLLEGNFLLQRKTLYHEGTHQAALLFASSQSHLDASVSNKMQPTEMWAVFAQEKRVKRKTQSRMMKRIWLTHRVFSQAVLLLRQIDSPRAMNPLQARTRKALWAAHFTLHQPNNATDEIASAWTSQ